MGGRHRKKVPVARRVALFGLLTSAVIVLIFAFVRPMPTFVEVTPIPEPPLIDNLTTPIQSTQPTTTPTTKPTRSRKTKQRHSSQAVRSLLPQDQTVTSVTPPSPRSISLGRTTAPSSRPQRPVLAPPSTTHSIPPVVIKSQWPMERMTTTSSKPAPKNKTTTPTTIPTTTPSAVHSAPSKQVIPRGNVQRTTISKPPTISPKPSSIRPTTPTIIPRVTSNSKCGTMGLQPKPRAACNQILAAFPQIKSVLGVGARAGNPTSCHPRGLAIDFIVGNDKALGDRLYAYVIARRSALGATPVVLWQVPNHYDHVHVSFDPCKG